MVWYSSTQIRREVLNLSLASVAASFAAPLVPQSRSRARRTRVSDSSISRDLVMLQQSVERLVKESLALASTVGAERAEAEAPLRAHGLSLIHISEPTRPY